MAEMENGIAWGSIMYNRVSYERGFIEMDSLYIVLKMFF